MRAGVVRAEGLKVTTVNAADLILIQQQQTNGNYLPREVAYSNFISGGASLTPNSVVLTNGAGDLTTNAGLTFAGSTLTFGATTNVINGASLVTPHVGGGKASAVLLPSTINNTVTGNDGDSVKLPPSAVGLAITVINESHDLQIFGSGTDTINGLATAVGTDQQGDTIVTYYCTALGNWWTTAQSILVGTNGNLGQLIFYPSTVNNGTLLIQATNNAGNFQSMITVASIGQATNYTFPDPGTTNASVILNAGAQTIGGVKTFTSVPIGIQEVVNVPIATITAQAGAITALFSAPFAGTVTQISAAVNGAFTSTNIVITGSIYHAGSPTAITTGVVTIPTAGSATGTTASATPSAANTFVVGDMISATITGGVGTVGGVISLLVTRTS